MNLKMATAILLASLFLGVPAYAGNDALAQTQTITTGERVATYLQSLMISAGAILEAKNPGDLINSQEFYRVGITYDPEDKVLDITVVGNESTPKAAQKKLEITQKLILGFNERLEKNFGVTLAETDIRMDYLDAKDSRIILKYRDGNFAAQAQPQPTKALQGPASQAP